MVFSVLAFLALFISFCIKDRKKSLCAQSMNCLFEAIYDFIIKAYTGAVLGIVTTIRGILFINKNKFNKVIYFIFLVIFEVIIVISCYFSWAGYISFRPTIGSLIRTYCLWQTNMKWVRVSGITSAILFGAYYIFYRGWFMVLGYVLLFIICAFEVYQNDIRKKKVEQK